MRMAGEQARAMAAHDKMDHDIGRPFQDRIRNSPFSGTIAVENISAGYHTLAEAFSGWRDSPPHRANMLNKSVTRTRPPRDHDEHGNERGGNPHGHRNAQRVARARRPKSSPSGFGDGKPAGPQHRQSARDAQHAKRGDERRQLEARDGQAIEPAQRERPSSGRHGPS